ncbi:TPA: terminase small subunit [Escherichia coli]|nr:terminase small subunit [Escherichia coli]HEI0663024.1 terminase small subunit [Escherichia coli]
MAREQVNEFGLTGKQEKFAQAFVETGDASEAYRRAYDTSKMNAASVNRKAHDCKEHVKISARVEQLRAKHIKRHNVTVDSLIAELEEARIAALTAETVQASAATGATMGKAKLLGLDKQLIEVSGQQTVTIQTKADMFKDLYGED